MNEEKQNHTSEAPEEVTEDNFRPYNVVAAAMNIPEIEDPLPLPPGIIMPKPGETKKQNHKPDNTKEVTEDNFRPYNVVAAAMNIPEIEDPLPLPPGIIMPKPGETEKQD